jgi:hypothetical protein
MIGVIYAASERTCQLNISPALMAWLVRCPMMDGHAEAGIPVPGRWTVKSCG